jgi:hypothetical protein
MSQDTKEKTREEKQAELDKEKRDAWENFQKLEYDKMNDEEFKKNEKEFKKL